MRGLGDAFITYVHIFSQKYIKSIFSKKGFFTIVTAVLLLSVFAALTLASLDLSIAVTTPDNRSICENATYTVNTTNTESTSISNITLNVMMPDGFWYTMNTTNITSNSSEGDASDIYLKIGNLPPQYNITNVTNVTYYLVDGTFEVGNLTNGRSKIVTFDFGVNHGACNATDGTLLIEQIYTVELPSTGLMIIKHLAGVIDECGDNASFLIEVKNVGETYAYDMNITELLPAGLQYVAGSSTVTGATPSLTNFTGNPLIWEFNQSEGWAPGTNVTITFNVTVTGPCNFTGGNAVAEANYTLPYRDFDIEAENGVKANDVNPHLSVTKTPGLTIAESGNTVNRTITIKNDGDYEVKNIRLKDVLPGNTGYAWSDPARNGGTGTSGDQLFRNLTTTTIHLSANVTGCAADLTEINATVFRGCCMPKKKSTAITELRTSPVIELPTDHDYIDTCGGNYTIRIENTGSSASVVSIIDVLPEGFVYRDNSPNITSSNGGTTFANEEPYTFGPRGPDIAYDSNGDDVTSKVNRSGGEYAGGFAEYWVNGTWNTGLPAGADVINANFSCEWWTLPPPGPMVVGAASTSNTLYFEYWNGTDWEEIRNESYTPDPETVTVDCVDVTSFLRDDYHNPKLRCRYLPDFIVRFDYLSLEIETANIQKTPDYHRNATIGEELNFTLFIDLPKAHVYNLTVNDTPSNGWIYNESSFNIRGNDSVVITDYSSSYINWTIGTVDNSDDEGVRINFTAIVNDTMMNQDGVNLSNNVTMHWDHAGLSYTDSDRSANTTIIEPDLGINKSANASVVEAGDIVSYTIRTNHTPNSTADAYDVWINDTVPEGLNILSNESNPQANRTMHSGNNLSWFYYKIESGMTFVFNYTAIVNDTVVAGQNLTNNSTLTWTSTNGTNINERYYNRCDSSQVSVINASIDLIKTVWNGIAWVDSCNKDIGDEVTFNLTIRNTGAYPLINITVNDTLPSGLFNASWINNSRTWAFAMLSTGGTIHIEFNATVNSSMVLVNQADVTARAENTSVSVLDEDNATVRGEGGGGGGGSDSHDSYDDSIPDELEPIDGADPNNPDTGDGTRRRPAAGTNDRLIPDDDPDSPIIPSLVVIPFVAFIFFITPLILFRVDVIDNGEIRPTEMSMLRSTVYVPEGVKIGKVLPGIVQMKADRALYTYLCETYDIPPSSAKAITIALGMGGLARVILQDERAYDLAIKMGLNAFKRR